MPRILMGQQGGSLEHSLRTAGVWSHWNVWGLGRPGLSYPHSCPDTARMAWSPNSRQQLKSGEVKLAGKYPWEGWSVVCPEGKQGGTLSAIPRKTRGPAMLWGPIEMIDSSVLVTSVRAAFPGFDERTGQQPSLRGAVA